MYNGGLATRANKAPATTSATMHTQGRLSFAKNDFPCAREVGLAVVGVLFAFPDKSLTVPCEPIADHWVELSALSAE